jgi:hypothetical protein
MKNWISPFWGYGKKDCLSFLVDHIANLSKNDYLLTITLALWTFLQSAKART